MFRFMSSKKSAFYQDALFTADYNDTNSNLKRARQQSWQEFMNPQKSDIGACSSKTASRKNTSVGVNEPNLNKVLDVKKPKLQNTTEIVPKAPLSTRTLRNKSQIKINRSQVQYRKQKEDAVEHDYGLDLQLNTSKVHQSIPTKIAPISSRMTSGPILGGLLVFAVIGLLLFFKFWRRDS